MLVNYPSLSDPLPAFSISLGVVGNYISQTPLLTGWDERRRKARVFLPIFFCLLCSLWQWLCLLHGFSFHQTVPPSNVPGTSYQPHMALAPTWKHGFWTLQTHIFPLSFQPSDGNDFLPLSISGSPHCPLLGFLALALPVSPIPHSKMLLFGRPGVISVLLTGSWLK